MCSELDSGFPLGLDEERQACSQPQPCGGRGSVVADAPLAAATDLDTDTLCFSQPAKPDHLLLASSPGDGSGTGGGESATPLQRLVRRMTRVLVSSSMQDTIRHLTELFDKLHYRTASHSTNIVSADTLQPLLGLDIFR